MKEKNINNYYSDEDLINFKKLNNFKEINNNNQYNSKINQHPFRYSISDNNNFEKIMNIKNDKTSSFKKTKKLEKNTYYNSSDYQKFNKLKQFANFKISKDSNTNKDFSKTVTSYTSDDTAKFDSIIKTKNEKTDNTDVNNKRIKIIDFNKLKEKERNFKNKLDIEKIKIVYFD